MPPAKLAEMPVGDVAALLKEEGQTMIDPKFLPQYVAEYMKAKNG